MTRAAAATAVVIVAVTAASIVCSSGGYHTFSKQLQTMLISHQKVDTLWQDCGFSSPFQTLSRILLLQRTQSTTNGGRLHAFIDIETFLNIVL